MTVVRELTVKLGLDTDFSTFDKAQKAIESVVSTAMDLVAAFEPVSNAIDEAVEAGSDIEETANKFAVVFGDAAGGVQTQLDNIRKHTGATNLELQKMASSIGAIVKPSLGSAKAAGEVSTQIALLAADISSFNNVSAERALIALRSGLIGSAEPLFAFGVDTRVAALEQEALRHGIKASIDEMSEGQRVMLRVAAIQRQLGTQGATGDATRTANQFANASRNLSKAIDETTGMVGALLLKQRTLSVLDMRRTINRIQEWIKVNRKLIMQRIDEFMERVNRVGRAISNVFIDLKDSVIGWFEALSPTTKRIMKITAAVIAFAAAMMLPFAPIILLIALVALLIEDFETWRKGGESLIGDFIKNFPQLIAGFKQVWHFLKSFFHAVLGWFKDQNLTADEWAQVIIKSVVKAAAVWSLMKAPMLFLKGLLVAVVAAIVAIPVALAFAVLEVVNFFKVLGAGFGQLVRDTGGIGAAFVFMLNEAFNWWLKFFGWTRAELDGFISDSIEAMKRWSVELANSLMAGFSGVLGEAAEFWADFFFSAQKSVTEFVNIASDVLKDFWKNVTDYWLEKAKGVFAKIGSFIPGFGDDEEEDEGEDAAANRGAAAVNNAMGERRAAERPEGQTRRPEGQTRRPEGQTRRPEGQTRRPEGQTRRPEDQTGRLQSPTALPAVPGPLGARAVIRAGTPPGQMVDVRQTHTANVSMTVNPSPGMDERMLADLTAAELRRALDTEFSQASQSYALESP